MSKFFGRKKLARIDRWQTFQDQLGALTTRDTNYDVARKHDYTETTGWHIDDYHADLPSEPPGKPIPNGSFAAAVDIMRNYEFPDPKIVDGIYLPDTPLAQRVMLIEGKFLFLRFYFGVRVSQVIDEIRTTDNGDVTVWGYGYQTLEGHWEMGEIVFEVHKIHATGEVSFYIHAYSKTGRIPNIIYRIGFWVFGRNLQIRFSTRACERMQELVTARLTLNPPPEELPQVDGVRQSTEAQSQLNELLSD